MQICSFEGCERVSKIKSLCKAHYNIWNKYGFLRPLLKRGGQAGSGLGRKALYIGCVIPECQNKHRAKGYCSNHYNQIAQHGCIKIKREKIAKEIVLKIKKELVACSEPDCFTISRYRGYCKKHYKIHVLCIAPKPRGWHLKKTPEPCYVEHCDNIAKCKGLCDKHYTRLRKHGDTGVNHHRKYRSKIISVDNILRPHIGNFSTADEREVIREMFVEYAPE